MSASPPVARLLALGILIASATASAETPIPAAPQRWLTDRAAFLTPTVAQELDTRLGDYARRTGHQVLVYIDRTTGGVPIEEAQVPDAVVSRIVDEQMVPPMRAGDNDGAVKGGVDALLGAIGASGAATAPAKRTSAWQLVLGGIVLVLLIGFAITHPGSRG